MKKLKMGKITCGSTTQTHLLGWPKSSFGLFRKILQKARTNFLADLILLTACYVSFSCLIVSM